jgi:two-component system phosphate regulon sensor histidine kinase PhoR
MATWGAWALAGALLVVAIATHFWAAFAGASAFAVLGWLVFLRRRNQPQVSADDASVQTGLSELAPFLEALPDPALLINAQGRLVSSNAAARKQLHFEERAQFLTAILRQPDVLEAVQAAVHDGATRAVEYEQPTQAERHTRCYVAPVNWGADRAALLVFHDQTASIRTERMRADFLANASHELRTPLASLTLLIETISGPARDNPVDRDRFLAMMQVQAERMRRLIDDLLSLSRIELDEHVPPTDRADLVAVAREVADTMTGMAQERGVALRVEAPDRPVMVAGERFQLAQVVQNLIDNAIKYSPAGEAVTVEVAVAGDREAAAAIARRWEEAGRAAILTPASAPGRAYAFVRVEDRGSGIAKRFLPRLGERFFRVERELGAERGGTGLGLAIVKHILNRHRGGFLVESQVGRGSAFVVYVEVAADD